MKKLETLGFKHFCMSIGNLPSSYVESLSYYECLLWLIKYLQEEVIPTVNNNSEVVAELQEAFVELQNYVDHYFDTLDIQTEIDNKLNEMADSGQLADIIALYLNANCILAYDTVADLGASENVTNGSFARTYGKLTYNDGYGAYYKIRTITSQDVIDGDNIVAITNNITLVAEKIPNNFIGNTANLTTTSKQVVGAINELDSDITTLQTSLTNEINTKEMKRSVILIGDSYAEGYGNQDLKGWGKYVIENLEEVNIPAIETYEGGSGMVHVGNDGHTFLQLLQNLTVEDPDSITDIVVAGGYNDNSYTLSEIKRAVASFMTYAKTNYPNAKIYFAMVGNNGGTDNTSLVIRNNLFYSVLLGYKSCVESGGIYIENSELINHDYTLFYSDNVHLTNYSYLGYSIYNALMHNGTNIIYPEVNMTFNSSGLPGFAIQVMQYNNNIVIKSPVNNITGLSATFNRYATISDNVDFKLLRAKFTGQKITIPVDIDITYDNGAEELYTMAYILLDLPNKSCTLFTLERYANVTSVKIGAICYTIDATTV